MSVTVSTRRTSLRVPREVLCVGQPSAQHREEPTVPEVTVYMFKSRGVPEMFEENDGEAHRRTSQSCRRRGAQPRTISHQYRARLRFTQRAKAQSGAAVPKQSSHAGREPRRTFYSAFPARIAHPCSCQVRRGSRQGEQRRLRRRLPTHTRKDESLEGRARPAGLLKHLATSAKEPYSEAWTWLRMQGEFNNSFKLLNKVHKAAGSGDNWPNMPRKNVQLTTWNRHLQK